MFRFFVGRRRLPVGFSLRRFSAQPPVEPSVRNHQPTFKDPSPPPPPVLRNSLVSPLPSLSTVSSSPPRSLPLYAVVGALISAAGLAAYFRTPPSDRHIPRRDQIYAEIEQTLEKSKGSVRRVADQMRQTGAAAAVLWKSLASMMSSANHEVRSGFEHRVAAFIADVSAVSGARRSAIVGAGSGAVVDWLLESVASSGNGSADHNGTQAESARALAHLIADHNVCPEVLGRPHAVPSLLKFIFSFQPKKSKKYLKHSSSNSPDICKGRSMLVAALMDIITSNCDNIDQASFQPMLPGNADMRDIAAAIEVIEQGGIHFNDHDENEDKDDGDIGMRGIGIKVLGGTTVLGFSGTKSLFKIGQPNYYQFENSTDVCSSLTFQDNIGISPGFENSAFAAVPGLWDDLQREHVAVPFAAWALANWAMASEVNRSHIQDLDSDGQAIMTALKAPERTVKWHGSLVARALLSDLNLPLTISVPDWSSSLLSTAFHASNDEDVSLARVALSAFLVSIERSDDAKTLTMKEGLHRMRGIAKQSEKHKHLQESLARALELLYRTGMHLSLEESQRWSGILLRWVFSQSSSLITRFSATEILSSIIEDYGPYTVPISQGWLTLLLDEIIKSSKATDKKGNTPPTTNKPKSPIDQSNVQSATQVVNQLAASVIRLEGEFEKELASSEQSPLFDFFSLEPFATMDKNMKRNNLPKFDSADSAFATLKGIKALTELCSGDVTSQNKIADFGVLCLLKRFLLGDDYEKLAANEAYAASRVLEAQGRSSTDSGGSVSDPKDLSSVRVPPTAHIRRHAARMLTILSLLPNVKKIIADDEIWCKWLENCACGKVPCCDDPKIQSYARAILLNIFCSEKGSFQNGNPPYTEGANYKTKCPQYEDMLFLLNPQLPHWKVHDKNEKNDRTASQDLAVAKPDASIERIPSHGGEKEDSETSCSLNGLGDDKSIDPLIDVVFIHGLRGGPFKSWRIADDKSSTTRKGGLIEDIDQDAGKQGTCWPSEWLSADFPEARLFTVKYKTNLTQWSGASLPLQEVSAQLLKKLNKAAIGKRPVVFVTHSMGGLVVKQMLYQAKLLGLDDFVKNTVGVVFYSCPHFGSKLADMPWRMGLVLRPAPTIGELRSGSPRLIELNDFIRRLHKKGLLEVLSFSETQVTPIVEGYGGWAFRAEVVAIESAYPGFGELVVLEDTDHVNSCKPLNRTDLSYSKTLQFLKKLRSHIT